MTGKSTVFCVGVLLALSSLTYAQEAPVLATSYDISVAIEDQVHRSRALVRSGHEIPVLLQEFKVGLRV